MSWCRLQLAFEALKRGEGLDPALPRFAGRAVAADRLSRRLKATWDAVQARRPLPAAAVSNLHFAAADFKRPSRARSREGALRRHCMIAAMRHDAAWSHVLGRVGKHREPCNTTDEMVPNLAGGGAGAAGCAADGGGHGGRRAAAQQPAALHQHHAQVRRPLSLRNRPCGVSEPHCCSHGKWSRFGTATAR